MQKNIRHAPLAALPVVGGSWAWTAQAAVSVQVLDSAGQPVPNAVVYAEPAGGGSAAKAAKQVEIEQKNKTFIPGHRGADRHADHLPQSRQCAASRLFVFAGQDFRAEALFRRTG
jgi:hypothetical protein